MKPSQSDIRCSAFCVYVPFSFIDPAMSKITQSTLPLPYWLIGSTQTSACEASCVCVREMGANATRLTREDEKMTLDQTLSFVVFAETCLTPRTLTAEPQARARFHVRHPVRTDGKPAAIPQKRNIVGGVLLDLHDPHLWLSTIAWSKRRLVAA